MKKSSILKTEGQLSNKKENRTVPPIRLGRMGGCVTQSGSGHPEERSIIFRWFIIDTLYKCDILRVVETLCKKEWSHCSYGAIFFIDTKDGYTGRYCEFWNGKGYSDSIQADAIPPGSQMNVIADAYDAITSDSVYRNGQMPRTGDCYFAQRVREAV